MKKILFSVFAVAAVMTACSKSDVVDAPNIDTPISFEAYSGKVPVTKATSIDEPANLASEGGFMVTAYKSDGNTYSLMEELLVQGTTTEGETSWSYGDPIYWPSDSDELTFIAHNNFASGSYDIADGNVLNVAVADDVLDQKDIVVATAASVKSSPEIALVFKHILSRVYFAVDSNRSLTVNSVTLSGKFFEDGVYNIVEGSYDTASQPTEEVVYDLLGEETFSYVANTGPKSICRPTAPSNHYMMILPIGAKNGENVAETADATITIEYQFENEDELKYTATAQLGEDFFFAKGVSYKFLLNMKTEAITFDVTVDGWEEHGTGENDEIELEPIVSAEVVSNTPAENA